MSPVLVILMIYGVPDLSAGSKQPIASFRSVSKKNASVL